MNNINNSKLILSILYIMSYKHKYEKYKFKYITKLLNKSMVGGDLSIKNILLDGTSSAGKSTICKFFEAIGYKTIASDDYMGKDLRIDCKNQYLASIDLNEYQPKNTFMRECINKYIYDDAIKYDKIVYDMIDQHILKNYTDPTSIYVIIVYASLYQLVDNIVSRRSTDPRGLFVFSQFVKKYESIQKDPTNTYQQIDTINFNSFVTKLKEKLKYEFESEEKLILYVTDLFKDMGINDIDMDMNYEIRLKKEYRCDYLINVSNKNKVDIFTEIYNHLRHLV